MLKMIMFLCGYRWNYCGKLNVISSIGLSIINGIFVAVSWALFETGQITQRKFYLLWYLIGQLA